MGLGALCPWRAIAGLGYLLDSFAKAAGSSLDVSTFTFIGEFLLALWLVIRGRSITFERERIARWPRRCSQPDRLGPRRHRYRRSFVVDREAE